MHVHFQDEWSDEDQDVLRREVDGQIRLSFASPPEDHNTEVLVAGRPDEKLLDRLRGLHSVIVPFAGPPGKTMAMLADRPDLSLYNIHHNAVPVAELALGLLLAAARHIPLRDRLLRTGDWTGSYHLPSMILRGKRVLILGRGAISGELEAPLRALGMELRFIRNNPRNGAEDEFHPRELHRLLEETDILISTLPLSDDSRGLIAEKELELLGPRGILINVGRGRVIDEDALYTALADRTIQAAGLDVWYHYPRGEGRAGSTLPGARPFWELENLVMSPHIAGEWPNPEVQRMRLQALARRINDIFHKNPVPKVETDRGY
ncbi:NAD(P)-dependent oxidoreductase [Salinispira pacifica]|uniref:D-3-phosphoglycerate dehydrogenase n=1 Tax=Salinispira pacifica TaxID=1307761 RepID=V5WJW7_9SPIO|nr:NAD(P)-dependent oxidoreductase [Salinispira pacifica]AHC15955.1 D-3-phosphoglycerate dehydrogenase [Salinispira pacifica]